MYNIVQQSEELPDYKTRVHGVGMFHQSNSYQLHIINSSS